MSLFIPVKKWDFRKVTIYPAQCFWIVDNLFLPKIGHFVRFSYWKSLASWGLIISSQKNPNLSSIKNLHERISYSGSCGDPPRKQNLHARKPRENSAKGVCQVRAAKAAAKAGRYNSRNAFKYSCAPSFTGNFPRITKHMSPRKPEPRAKERRKPCARKNGEAVATIYKD